MKMVPHREAGGRKWVDEVVDESMRGTGVAVPLMISAERAESQSCFISLSYHHHGLLNTIQCIYQYARTHRGPR
jgi:hypothetical protein